jgi:putative membrane protein
MTAIANWLNMHSLVNSIVYALVGMLMLGLGFYIWEKITPGKLWKEIIDEHNIALAVIVAAMVLGISNIIASAITG